MNHIQYIDCVLNEKIEFVLDKESEEYNDIKDSYGIADTDKINKDMTEISKNSVTRFKKKVPLWNNIKIIFVKNLGKGLLGRFRNETSSSVPIIMMSEKNILSASKEYNVPLWITIETTIFHELGHAICELERDVFGYKYLEYGNEEEWVEDFAYKLHENDVIPDDLKTFIKEYKK